MGDSVLAQEMKDGGVDNNIYMGFLVTYKTAAGATVVAPFYIRDRLVQLYAQDWLNSWVDMTLGGADTVTELQFTIFVSYGMPDSGVVVELSDPMTFGN